MMVTLRTGLSWLTGLSYILLLWKSVEGQTLQPPTLETKPKNIQDLRENTQLELKCTFTSQSGQGPVIPLVVITRADNTELPTSLVPLPKTISGLHNVINIATLSSSQFSAEYTVQLVTSRTINNLRFSCVLRLTDGGVLSNTSDPFNVKYEPLDDADDFYMTCVSTNSRNSSATLYLNASEIVRDPGNPTSTVMWSWQDNGRAISSGQVSGRYEELLTTMVTRDDAIIKRIGQSQVYESGAILAFYNNTIGHTMQKFILCVKSVSDVPTNFKCQTIAVGYNCTWNDPVDDGGETVSSYCYGHVKGRNAGCPTSSKCQLNPTTAVANTLDEGTPYVVYVYAVNSLGNGNCSTDMVITRLGAPEIVTVVTGQTSLTVKWSQVKTYDNGNDLRVLEYLIEYKIQDSSLAHSRVMAKGNETQKDILNLQSNTTYSLRMLARNSIGNGRTSDPSKATTLIEGEVSQVPNVQATAISSTQIRVTSNEPDAGGEVSQVPNVQATAISSTEIRVMWNEPDAGGEGFAILSYTVNLYRQDRTTAERSVEVKGSMRTVTIFRLMEDTSYDIEVIASNGRNTGRPSDRIVARTQSKTSSSGSNSAVIGGAVAGSIVGIFLVVGIIVCYRLRMKATTETDVDIPAEKFTMSSAYGITTSSSTAGLQETYAYANVQVANANTLSPSSMTSNPSYSTASHT